VQFYMGDWVLTGRRAGDSSTSSNPGNERNGSCSSKGIPSSNYSTITTSRTIEEKEGTEVGKLKHFNLSLLLTSVLL
jgi:hypothetical protein